MSLLTHSRPYTVRTNIGTLAQKIVSHIRRMRLCRNRNRWDSFGDEDGAHQARRRRFQTGLLIFLLLFFMDSRPPQDARRSKRNAQTERDTKTMAKTVKQLAENLKGISGSDPVAIREKASITASWRTIDAKDVQTIVPAMEEATSGANRSSPFEVGPGMGSDTNNLFPAEKTVPGEMTRSNMTENPDVIAVHGWLKLGDGLTRNPRGENAAFEGLFFRKFGYISALVGVKPAELQLVWNASDSASLPRGVVAPNASVDDRLASDAVGGSGAAAANVTSEGAGVGVGEEDYTVDEDSAKRERVLRVVGGAGPGQGQQNRPYSAGEERSGRALSEATDWVTWGAIEDQLVKDAGERLRGRGGEGDGLRGARRGQWGEVSEQGERVRRDRAQPSHEQDGVAHDDTIRNRDGGGSRQRHLDATKVTPAPTTAKLLFSAENITVAESGVALQALDSAQSAGIVPVAVKGERPDGLGSLRKFPARVLPKSVMVGPDQISGPLPSQFFSLSRSFDSRCLYLLTLQTIDNTDGGNDEDKRGDSPRTTWVDEMRGELVGVNCAFSAEIEVQFSATSGFNEAWSYPAMILLFCILHMCVLCCRIGFILARRRYGRNFMVPRRFQPPKFDYHRPIPPELAEQVSRETAGGQDSEEGRDIEAGNLLECAICYASVDGALEDYMLTPCDHVFHQGCLMRWMDVKMECPTCRRELPPPLE